MNRKFNIIKIIVLLFCAFQVNAQNTLDNLGLSSSTPAAVAYSLRLLSTSYTGPLVRIRIGSSFYDVYPDTSTKKFALSSKISAAQSVYNSVVAVASSNALSSIITSGTTNATVAIWYDQSGNAVNVLTNSVTGPKIITLGSINKMNGQPTMLFDGANQPNGSSWWWLKSEIAQNYSAELTTTINAIVQNNGTINSQNGVFSNSPAVNNLTIGWGLNYNYTKGYTLDGWGCEYATTGLSTTPKLITGLLNKTTNAASIYENSILKQAGSIGCNITNGTADYVRIGQRGPFTNGFFNGNISELIRFPSNLSTVDQSTLETNQKTNYFTPTISLTSAVGTNTQSLCSTTAITAITYETAIATGATFSGLPAGVSGTWLNNVVTIAGTPTVFGTNNYTVTLTGIPETVTATGTITYQESPTVTLNTSPATVCSNIPANFNGSSICGPNGAINSSASSTASRALLTNVKDNITMETWVKWSGTAGGYQIIFYNGHTGNGGYGIITNSSGNLQILIGGKSFLDSNLYLTPGIWQHVAIVRNAGTWSIYLNGTQYPVANNTTTPIDPNAAAGNGLFVGKNDSGNQLFAGDIDELKFWTVVRSTSEIQSDMKACTLGASTGLLAYWSLNDATGNTALDGSGNSNNLSITNPNWITAGAPTGGSYAIDFGDGTVSSLGADTHTYTTPGIYNVTINATAANGCTSSVTSTVTVNQSPTATISGTTTGCAVVSLTAAGGTTYAWSGGNATTTASNTFNNSGNYTVTATDAIGCWNKATQSVIINDLPLASISGALPTSTNFANVNDASGLVYDASGNLFVGGGYSGTISKITTDGTVSDFTSGSMMMMISSITMDSSGNIFIGNQYGGTISKITPDGTTTQFASGFQNPAALTFDATGNLFVADENNDTINKITSDGTVSTFATGIMMPSALVFDAAGNLFVGSQNTIRKITPSGAVSTFASGFNRPTGMTFDTSGNLYVADQYSGNINKITTDGTVSVFASGLNSPKGLVFDSAGRLVTSINYGTIIKITFPAVNITTVCSGASVTLIATPASGEEIDWYAAATGGTALLTGSNNYVIGALAATTTYYAESRNTTTGCVAATRTPITATNASPVVTISASSTSITIGESVTLTASGANSYIWENSKVTPLDNVSNSNLAVGLRKLKSTYIGSAIRLRRESDNAEADFGFVSTELDTAAITTWLAGANGYCVTLYDQSGSGNNMTPSNPSRQPLFVSDGLNNKPILRFNNSQDIGNTTNFQPPFTVIYGAKQTGPNRNRVMTSMSNNWLLGWWGGSKAVAHYDGWITSGNAEVPDNNAYVYSGTGNGSNSYVYENGISKTTNTTGGLSGPNGITINYGESSESDITEIYAFHSVLSTVDREKIESSIASYYNIYQVLPLATTAAITLSPIQTSTYSVTGYSDNGLCSTSNNATITVIYNAELNNFNNVTKSFYDISYTLTPPTSNSLGAFTYTSSDTNVATVNGNLVTFVGPGTTTITAIQAANGFYLSDSITATLTVTSTTVLTTNGAIANNNLNYVNKNGALTSATGVSTNGEIIATKTPYNALNFSSSLQNYATLPPATYFSGDFTIECWVYPTAHTNWSRVIDFGNGTSNNVLFATSSGGSGKPGLHISGSQFEANDQLVLNQWSHIAVTLSGTTATIYINGIASGTSTFPVPANVIRNDNYIGRSNWGWGDPAPDATFDDLRIWSVAKTDSQIVASMNKELSGTEAGLVAYFKFNDGIACGANSAITTLTNSASSGAIYNATLQGFTLNGGCTSNFVNGKITSELDGLTSGSAARSAFAIKQAFPSSTDGLYWITNPNINGGTPFQVYADMTTDGGGWTLLLCNNSNSGWDGTNAILRNETNPTINGQYSIIAYADYLKKSASGFQYMIDAQTRGQWGGIWTANQAYSFVHTANDQTDITLNTKFSNWEYANNSIEAIMPWYAPGQPGAITTSTSPSGEWWGTLVSTAGYNPTPYMSNYNSEPGIIWYWVR